MFSRWLLGSVGLLARVAEAAAAEEKPTDPATEIQTPPTAGDEDRDADGVSNRAERKMNTDPDVPGLFPGSYPHIPEPLRFDLVRGLGARRGEFEVNVLMGAGFLPHRGIDWAPEIEWAFADRHAIEFEIPMHNGEVEALKLALQGTFSEQRPKFIHGWQVIGEAQFEGSGEITAIYIAGRRFGRRTSGLAMIGPRVLASSERVAAELILNPSIFVDINERVTIGLENNASIAGRESSLHALPQVHLQLGQHLRIQVGGGVEVTAQTVSPTVGVRVIVE